MTGLTASRDDLRLWHHQKSRYDSSLNTPIHSDLRMGSNTSKEEVNAAVEQPMEEDDEPDEW